MAESAVLPAALQSYLTTCSSQHAEQIIEALRVSQGQNAEKETPVTASSMKIVTGLSAVKTGKKQRTKKVKLDGATGGPKRPLNSWMAFRKYYSASLSPHTQKAISKILMSWWRADPFDAKWAVLAKAYSVLRGSREKEEVPLDDFFLICAPLIGVIPPNQYQQLMGWTMSPPSNDDREQMPQVKRAFVPSFDTFPMKFTTTNLSVNELVQLCVAAGYAKPSTETSSTSGVYGALTMAVQPSTVTTFIIEPPAVATPVGTDSHMTVEEDGNIAIPLSPFSRDLVFQLTRSNTADKAEPAGKIALDSATMSVSSAGVYPYNDLFDPTSQFDISFDPAGEDPAVKDGGVWDAYDPTTNMAIDDVMSLDWMQFVHQEKLE